MSANKFIAVIPAHLASVRFPNKILHPIHGLPMVEHVRRRAKISGVFHRVIVATCDMEIAHALEKYDADVMMTSNNHLNGSSRVFEVSQKTEGDYFCILQGDEPTIPPAEIESFVKNIQVNINADVWNAVAPLKEKSDLDNPSFVKATISKNSCIHYCFRRSPSHKPFHIQKNYIAKILGLICFTKQALKKFNNQEQSLIEYSESIEQLRLLELKLDVKGLFLSQPFPSINEPIDEKYVLEFLARKPNLSDLDRVLNFGK
jgi:3-deoxy-manno-octulosonate cytidylyltransferase (CMP-KDO synthetase)